MEKNKFKGMAQCVCGILVVLALLFFGGAIGKGFCHEEPSNQVYSVRVYVNDIDSIIEQLQNEVELLTTMIHDMQQDSLVISVSRIKK